MTNLVDKISKNIQTSMGYYLLNRVLASMLAVVKIHEYYSVSTCRAIVHSFQNTIWTGMTLLLSATSFVACVHDIYDTI